VVIVLGCVLLLGCKSGSAESGPAMQGNEQVRSILLSQLTPAERESAVAYWFVRVVESGAKLAFPHVNFEAPWDAELVFIDQQPLANWGHPCRYLLVNLSNRETVSFASRFPPFQPESRNLWRVLYRASAIPDSAIAVPDPPAKPESQL
jgi:hypothetical protein